MNARLRSTVIMMCGAAMATAAFAYALTGFHAFTRWRDPEIEQANAQTHLTDLFAESGGEEASPPPSVQSVNAIGLLPSGPGWSSLSLVTIAGPALVLMGLAWRLGKPPHIPGAEAESAAGHET